MDILKSFITDWLTGLGLPIYLTELITILVAVTGWILLGYIFSFIAKFIISRLKAKERHLVKRQKTVTALVIALIKYIFWFVMAMMVLKEFGLDLAPILASAGILGFAIGFGAQELIKDLIAGFFIIFENAFSVGDFIQLGDFSGTVLEVGIRRTKLINWKNEIRMVNNGDIKVITNFSTGNSIGVVEFIVSPQFDLRAFYSEEFVELLENYANKPDMVETPTYLGVVETQLHMVKLRVRFATLNQKHWAYERELRRDIQMFIQDVRERTKVF